MKVVNGCIIFPEFQQSSEKKYENIYLRTLIIFGYS